MPAHPRPSPVPVVPGYVLEELLGRGGSGEVWRARPRRGGPPVAVKVLIGGDPQRQEREAALLGELDHPHLVRLHEVVRSPVRGGTADVAIVLDLLAGGSLAALLARRGRLRPGEVVTTVAPVAAALAHAHDRGVVHGDLSPGNVVFTAEGRPVLTDLGTARLVGDAVRAECTPAYVDPVVARGGASGPASDVFGVAAAAFHALTGVAPWNAADGAGTLAVAAVGELPDLALLAPEAPAELVRVVLRGLSAEPHLRGSAAAFALDVRHACRPEPVRLPGGGGVDADLYRTGQGARTELTHQVPGRARAAHAAPVQPGRLARLRAGWPARVGADGDLGDRARALVRRVAVVGAVLLAVAAALAGAAWAGARWGDAPAAPRPAAEAGPADTPATSAQPAAPAATAPPPGSGPGPTLSPPGDVGAGSPAADRSDAPADTAGWAEVLDELYARRAAAFTAADAALLDGVYAPGSPLGARDTAQVAALAGAGQVLAGFGPQVRQVVSVLPDDGGGVRVRLVDELPGYRVAAGGDPAASPVQEVAGRGEAEVELVLTPTTAGWRIADARMAG